MLSRIFWVIAAILFVSSLVLFAQGVGGDGGALMDFRAWLLLASGIAAAAIGNVVHHSSEGH